MLTGDGWDVRRWADPSVPPAPVAAAHPWIGFSALLLALTFGPTQGGGAQTVVPDAGTRDVVDLADRCAVSEGRWVPPCRELALAAMAMQQGFGLASALGSDIPGSPSTMGRRLGMTPRIGLSLSALGTKMSMPRIAGSQAKDLGEREAFSIFGLRAAAAATVLDGFRLTPVAGGVLAVDVVASYAYLRLPGNVALSGSPSSFGVGTRIGLVRESFMLPGVSVSAVRRWHGDIRAGSISQGNPGEVETDLTVSSLRAVAGKNWFVVGIMGGVGLDRYEGNARVAVTGIPASAKQHIRTERKLFFAAAWFNFVIAQVSLEAGLAEGVDDPFPDRLGAFAPGDRTWFAVSAFRITL